MKKSLLVFSILGWMMSAHAQSSDTAVVNCVNRLFLAMKEANDSLILDCFTENARLQSITKTPSNPQAHVNTFLPKDFATNVLKRAKGSYDERISGNELMIKTDGELTMAWIPYVFYLDGKFSHCGVDLFSMVKMNGVYKISNLVFNMRNTDCNQ